VDLLDIPQRKLHQCSPRLLIFQIVGFQKSLPMLYKTHMTVKELKEQLNQYPDDYQVVAKIGPVRQVLPCLWHGIKYGYEVYESTCWDGGEWDVYFQENPQAHAIVIL
jgi:hypothetical protein